MKYHIGKNGIPSVCHALSGHCPFGDESRHFSSIQEAQQFADKQNSVNFIKNKSNSNLSPEVVKKRLRKRKHKHTSRKILDSRHLDKDDFYNRIETIQYYKSDDLNPKNQTYHFQHDRRHRREMIEKEVGKGKVINRFVIRKKNSRLKEIHEIYDNGLDIIYGESNKLVLTEFILSVNRINSIYDKLGIKTPKELIDPKKVKSRSLRNKINKHS